MRSTSPSPRPLAPEGHRLLACARSLQSMAVFASVVDARSFTAAARALGITTSAVSKCVARLEGHLGVRLLARTTRSLELTEAGRIFHERCQGILREVGEAERALADGAAPPPPTGA